MNDITSTQLTARFFDGPMKGKEYSRDEYEIEGVRQFVPKIQVPFMTDGERITDDGRIQRVFKYLTYELKTWVNPQGNKESVYVLVHDEAYELFKKFEANPELIGAKWYADDENVYKDVAK